MYHASATALVVLDYQGEQPVGVITAADLARAVADGKDLNEIHIHNLFTTHPAPCPPPPASATPPRPCLPVVTSGYPLKATLARSASTLGGGLGWLARRYGRSVNGTPGSAGPGSSHK